jgi:hypothetical protein
VPDLRFQVVVNPLVESEVDGVVAFGNFTNKGDAAIYPEDGVLAFHRDLILGRALPLVFVTKQVNTLGVLTAIALFLHRDLAIHPNTPGFVFAVDLVDRYGVSGHAHLDRDLSRFFRLVRGVLVTAKGRQDQKIALDTTVSWIREYIHDGGLPGLPPESEPPRILDRGTDGFVLATSDASFDWAWEELFRMGFLRGLLAAPILGHPDHWSYLGARKSPFLVMDLRKAADILNEGEAQLGDGLWTSDGMWLFGPKDGTLLPPASVVNILTRV